MKKKILCILTAMLIIISLAQGVYAADQDDPIGPKSIKIPTTIYYKQ